MVDGGYWIQLVERLAENFKMLLSKSSIVFNAESVTAEERKRVTTYRQRRAQTRTAFCSLIRFWESVQTDVVQATSYRYWYHKAILEYSKYAGRVRTELK